MKAIKHRLRQFEYVKRAYYTYRDLMGYYDVENRVFDTERVGFDGYELLLDTDKYHQNQLATLEIKHEIGAFLELIDAGDRVCDVGANVGGFAIPAAHERDCEVFAFEPEPKVRQLLRQNIELNHLGDAISVFGYAMSDELGQETLHVSGLANQGGHSLVRNAHHSRETVEVPTAPMDHFAEFVGSPDVVKIDVEGAEALVLDGMADTLSNGVKMHIDVHEYEAKQQGTDPSDVIQRLVHLGEVFKVTTGGLEPAGNVSNLEAPVTLQVQT